MIFFRAHMHPHGCQVRILDWGCVEMIIPQQLCRIHFQGKREQKNPNNVPFQGHFSIICKTVYSLEALNKDRRSVRWCHHCDATTVMPLETERMILINRIPSRTKDTSNKVCWRDPKATCCGLHGLSSTKNHQLGTNSTQTEVCRRDVKYILFNTGVKYDRYSLTFHIEATDLHIYS